MKKNILLLLIFLSTNIYASEILFQNANNFYKSGEYENAIALYDEIISDNFVSHELYYNIGNCYYKLEKWADAIWYYEKSLQLKKTENAIQNLQLAELKIVDRIETLPELFFVSWWNNIINILSIKTWQILSILLVWLALLIKILKYKIGFSQKYMLKILLILSFTFFFIANYLVIKNKNTIEGVIYTNSIDITSAPTNNSTVQFTIHAGSKVQIIDQIQDWVNIRLKNGSSGWVKEVHIKKL